MLDADTKRKIDTARDILVGKVPDPKTQVEQITFALIYKFMDNMDQQSVGLGGKPSFFTNGYEQYAWSKLLDRKKSGADRLDLYVRALEQMSQNPYIPQLFRDIFKGAFLPYRDSETLNLFLKELDGFRYDHSEDLGDAYEYLLNILGTQGKAGQFRTPRHIIDFIVRCVDPDKNETVLDPACGTAGFLISAFKHIEEKYREHPLSPDEKKRLTQNFTGYDIAPDMVRLSRVNMYLHQFPNPTIHEYDTLTTEDRWDDSFDVILANPPFMTPKGGIRPHNRFAVRANRSEVLFVDYIAEHLNPGGRAGIIVPEGIIFQSSNAYKALRKMLVEGGYLYAVVSLPAGVFNPYSGVKTSILLLDKSLARRADSVLFVKVSADGFDLGAQRREIERNDLPEALALVKAFQADPQAESANPALAQRVSKIRLSESEDYNLSAERYRENGIVSHKWPMVSLGVLESENKISFLRGQGIAKADISPIGRNSCIHYGEIYTLYDPIIKRVYSSTDLDGTVFSVEGDVLVPATTTADALGISVARALNIEGVIIGGDINIIRTKNQFVDSRYLSYLINFPPLKISLSGYAKGANILHLSNSDLRRLTIPLPPMEVQQEIVAEIEGYQKVIDGARMVVENYKPVIPIDPSWPLVKLGEVCEVNKNSINPFEAYGEKVFVYVDISSVENGTGKVNFDNLIRGIDAPSRARRRAKNGDIIISTVRPNLEAFAYIANLPDNAVFSTGFAVVSPRESILGKFLFFLVKDNFIMQQMIGRMEKGSYPSINQEDIKNIIIPLPPMEEQMAILRELDRLENVINLNRMLIKHFSEKIEKKIARIWS